MPLTELMNYFNDQLQVQSKLHSLPKNGFFKLTNSFAARFGNLLISTNFKKIIYKNEYLYGFYGELTIRSVAGNQLNIHDVFNSLDNKEQIVHLDRLSRTLLSLNFLQQFDQHQVKLFVPVHPRHIASISGNHGKIFEVILSDCGLGPERVSLYTRLSKHIDIEHFNRALKSYQERGYSISIEINNPEEIDHLEKLNLSPDYVLIGTKLSNYWIKHKKAKPSLTSIETILLESESYAYLNEDIDYHLIDQLDENEKRLGAYS